MRCLAALGALLLLVSGVPALHAAEVVLRIHPDSQVSSARATLADVADIDADQETRARLAGLAVAELPTLTPVAVDARLLTALTTRAASPATVRIIGSGTVSRRCRVFATDELVAAASAATAAGSRCSLVRVGDALSVPDAADLRLQAEPLDPAAVGEVPFRVRAMEGERESGRTLVVLQVERDVEIVVAVRDLAAGEAVGAGDLRVERRLAQRGNLAAAIDPAVLSGTRTRRAIAAGEPVSVQMVAPMPAVRAGARVTVVWPGQGFSVELQATALADARAGERLGLRRVGDGAMLRGIAQADGSVLADR